KEARCAIGGGTFSANPLTMTAGLATLNFLRKNPAVYSKINKLGDAARKGLVKIFAEEDLSCEVTGTGSIFMPHFDKTSVHDANDVATSNKSALNKYHLALMAEHGIFFLPGKMGAISFSHDNSDVKRLLAATEEICRSGILK
ncbi:MAG: aspartate aminotransferase family protein, partial [Nitrososphaera sp.]